MSRSLDTPDPLGRRCAPAADPGVVNAGLQSHACSVGHTRLVAALALVALTGCATLRAQAAPASRFPEREVAETPAGPPVPTTQLPQPETPQPPAGQEAPAACGFPPGTALSYAGRSTTAALDVQEIVGDPMSDDPADIYITRDALDQGEHHGRLVCAIFVGDPGFVEITVHPEDGGRFEPPLETPAATAPPLGISVDEAVEAALGAAPSDQAWEVQGAEAGPLGKIGGPGSVSEPMRDLSPDQWVWRVLLVRADDHSRGAFVFVDYVDGSVYSLSQWIS
jgi:hypothetical protein